MSSPSPNAAPDDSGAPSSVGLACNRCRKAKLRCSRDLPTCENCRKTGLDCVYETKRIKPGLKAGAVENLHKRLDALERLLLDRDSQPHAHGCTTSPDGCRDAHTDNGGHNSTADRILSLLAKELPKLVHTSRDHHVSPLGDDSSLDSRKRRRVENESPINRVLVQPELAPPLAPGSYEPAVSMYFSHIHPWIPMINQARFRRRLSEPTELPNLEVVLQAMVMSTLKFLSNLEDGLAEPADGTRKWIISTAMDCLSVESLQALIIMAFNDIGNGNAARAWSIVGSLTRTVEYNQITIEHEESDRQPFSHPFASLKPALDWSELEERRRVFWNVFNLDRLCSVMMGWNTSLTSDDVRRRLPCDGVHWRKEEVVVTPYLGIWDKSAGRIGNPIAVMPSRYQAPDRPLLEGDPQNQPGTTRSAEGPDAIDMSRVGAFAYCVEATESMSRVTSYFLQQRVNIRDQSEINSWLTRFKELDLRLVHWKMLLPQKWKTNMTKQATRMDPNLTLAHVTHNASMILLHQLIAYPPPSWSFRKKLPSVCSAETCCSASVEISTITENYLAHTPDTLPVTSQYAFCVYVAARILLVHWRYDAGNRLLDEFWTLTRGLEEMSRRWIGVSANAPMQHHNDLAAKYARKLRELNERCAKDDSYRINVADYTHEIDQRGPNAPDSRRYSGEVPAASQPPIHPQNSQAESRAVQWAQERHVAQSRSPFIALKAPISGQPPFVPSSNHALTPGGNRVLDNTGQRNMGIGEFNTTPPMLLDPYFMEMDRVITFDDGSMFAGNLEGGSW